MHNATTPAPELLTIQEVADYLRVSAASVSRWVAENKIPHVKLFHHVRFERDAIIRFFKERTEEGKAACFQSPLLIEPKHISLAKVRERSVKRESAAKSDPKKG